MNTPRHLDHDWFPRPLPANAVIGERSWCYSSFAFQHCQSRVARGIEIGRDTGIYNGTFFDLGPHGSVHLGNFVTLVGVIVSVDGHVTIGDYCFLAHEVVLADRVTATPDHGDTGSLRQGDIVLEENCWVGMRAIILGPARIGQGAIIGAAAVVDFDVPPFAIVAGNPAKIVGWANRG